MMVQLTQQRERVVARRAVQYHLEHRLTTSNTSNRRRVNHFVRHRNTVRAHRSTARRHYRTAIYTRHDTVTARLIRTDRKQTRHAARPHTVVTVTITIDARNIVTIIITPR